MVELYSFNRARSLEFSVLNTRSIRNKSLIVKDLIVDRDIDILALTETWLTSRDLDSQIERDICPTGYELHSMPRGRLGGGVALVYKKPLRFQKQSCISTKFKSFEFIDLLMRHSCSSLRVVTVYRPPPSKSNNSSLPLFCEEFPRLLEHLVTAPGALLMAGDFNFHIEDDCDTAALRFLNLIEAFNLKEHITEPTHKSGHTLDLTINRAEEDVARNFTVYDPVISDHLVVGCTLSILKKAFERKEVSYRKIKSVDMEQLREDIKNSCLVDPVSMSGDLDTLTRKYNMVLSELLDKHALLKKHTSTLRPATPW